MARRILCKRQANYFLKIKKRKHLTFGLSDKAVIKNNIKKDEVIKLDDVDLNLPKEVINARNYQYSLI